MRYLSQRWHTGIRVTCGEAAERFRRFFTVTIGPNTVLIMLTTQYMNLIKLTNNNGLHNGELLLLNCEMIATVNRGTVTRDSGMVETVTFVYMPPHGTWEVSETVEQIMALCGMTDLGSTADAKILRKKKLPE